MILDPIGAVRTPVNALPDAISIAADLVPSTMICLLRLPPNE